MYAVRILTAAFAALAVAAALSAPSPFKCSDVAVDGYRYDLSDLDK